MKQNYTYPVIINFSDEKCIILEYPDFNNALTSSFKEEDYISAAQDYLVLTIKDFEDGKKELPKPSNIEEIELNDYQKCVYINVWMPYHQSKIKETYIKKTLTIPTWLNILAKSNEINFSQVLVKALKEELGL